MNIRDDAAMTRTDATAFEPPALVPIGDAENVVLGIPGIGDDYLGFTPPGFEFQEDNDEACVAPSLDGTNPECEEEGEQR